MLRETTESGIILPGETNPVDPKLDPTLLVQEDTPAQVLPQQVYERIEYDINPAEHYLEEDCVHFLLRVPFKTFVASEKKGPFEVSPVRFDADYDLRTIRQFYLFVDVYSPDLNIARRFTTDEFFGKLALVCRFASETPEVMSAMVKFIDESLQKKT